MSFLRGKHHSGSGNRAVLWIGDRAGHRGIIALAECGWRCTEQEEKDSSSHGFTPPCRTLGNLRNEPSLHPDREHQEKHDPFLGISERIPAIRQRATRSYNNGKILEGPRFQPGRFAPFLRLRYAILAPLFRRPDPRWTQIAGAWTQVWTRVDTLPDSSVFVVQLIRRD